MSARILVIEDNPPSLELMHYLLTAYGHTVLTAEDGADGIEMALREVPDLIVCDIQLPTLDGYQVVSHLRENPATRAIPVIALTALAMVGDRERVISAGFDDYLSKPIVPERFLKDLDRFLGAARSDSHPHSDKAPVAEAEQCKTKATVLVVDDGPDNREFVRSLLSPLGYSVVTASSAREALARAAVVQPDLILSDVCMADGDGYRFIQDVKAREDLAGVPFIFVTSSMNQEIYREKGLALGADRFLFRPIEAELLLAEISACLESGG